MTTKTSEGSMEQFAANLAMNARLKVARSHAESGRLADAETGYLEVLVAYPGNAEAAIFVAQRMVTRGDQQSAITVLQHARAFEPENAQLLNRLGLAYESTGDSGAALSAFAKAVEINPDFYLPRLHMAALHERQGSAFEALTNYYRAITTAQTAGVWLDAGSTQPWLREKVVHGMQVVERGRSELFNGCLAPLRDRFGASELVRMQSWLDSYLSFSLPVPEDPRQKPKFMYFPGLPSKPFFERELFPFIEALEASTSVICTEMEQCLQDSAGFVPFLGIEDPAQLKGYLENDAKQPVWDAFFFYRHGSKVAKNQQACPATTSVLERLPLVRIREHAPEICFSMLTPGTHILPHHGVTNTRLVMHLPLVVPDGCSLVVGGQSHQWKRGECVVFDDTYLHEAWNFGSERRVVLILDVWNPYLSEAERLAITELVGTIGDFNRAIGM